MSTRISSQPALFFFSPTNICDELVESTSGQRALPSDHVSAAISSCPRRGKYVGPYPALTSKRITNNAATPGGQSVDGTSMFKGLPLCSVESMAEAQDRWIQNGWEEVEVSSYVYVVSLSVSLVKMTMNQQQQCRKMPTTQVILHLYIPP